MNKQEWCIDKHRKTNHFYDTYLPYEFHLRMVDAVYQEFKYLLDDVADYYTLSYEPEGISLRRACGIAVWGHDLIEDCRVSYNDCAGYLGNEAADIIYAVTNEKGRTRSERANDNYYFGIRTTRGATFVKLCDRIANVQYSKMTKSRMFEMYKKENEHFMKALDYSENHELIKMFDYLIKLFE